MTLHRIAMTQKNTIVLFDIDFTIFNTDSYIEKMYKALGESLGYTDEESAKAIWREAYKETKHEEGYFNPDIFLQKLLTKKKNDATIQYLQEIFWNDDIYADCLFGEVKEVFDGLAAKEIIIGIFSTGYNKHQQQKIKTIRAFLKDEHIHIFADKLTELENVLRRYKDFTIYVVDDLPEVLQSAKKAASNIITVKVEREKIHEKSGSGESEFVPDKAIHHLNELIEIVS